MLLAAHFVEAQQEPTLPLSQRQTIDLAAGVPQYIGDSTTTSNAPQSHWLFEGTNTEAAYASPTFVESSDPNATWATTVVPFDANATRTFINQTSGGGAGSLNGQNLWFRLHFKVAPKYAGQKFLLNLEGVHTGVQVYINGTLLPGISAVAADQQATHVLGFVPVAVDLTPYLVADGATDNVIAIYASRGASWFETPGFSEVFRFGQAMAGPFRYVHLVITNPVHVPLNAYSNLRSWGTYVGTISEVPGAGTATAASALVDVQTNVVNESPSDQQVTLTTQIVDAQGNVLITASPVTETVPSVVGNPSAWPSGPGATFDQKITVPNPTLWYPNNSIYGTPYCYKVYHILSINGVVVDSVQTTLGIRTITWDQNFPYFNGHPMYLWGGGSRYDYPALGAAVPREQVWRDMQLLAAQGGNVLRPGHSTSSEEVVEAADALGIMIDQPSGDGEGNWNAGNYTADDWQLKQEVHRDMIVRDRSHPSILDWERDNGGLTDAIASQLATIESTWDHINTRASADRGYQPSWGLIDECDGAGCEIGNKGEFPNNPAFGAEYWDNTGTARGAWDYELAFAAQYVDDWRRGRAANAFGMAQWYAWDSPGEQSLWAEYQNSTPGVDWSQEVRSLGYSSTDQNRFPRFLYYIYQANWVPYSIQPVVHLAHHWNRAYEYTPGTPLQENAVSNCPGVRLLINGVSQDPLTGAVLPDQTPNPWTTDSSTNLGQNTTVMPAQVHWMVNWAPGTVQAVCLDQNGNPVPGVSDAKTTAGPEYQIVLSEVPRVKKPDGTSFQWTANGFDSDMIIAQVEDANGNIVPTATDNVTFTVTGEATYQGGTQQLVYDTNWVSNFTGDAFSQAHSSDISGLPFALYHSPRDPELNFEGGLQKIAIQSTFTPGTATVTASAPGLITGSITVTSVAPEGPVLTQAPAIIVPPADTATTQGYAVTFTVAASGSGTLSYQWYENGGAVGTNGSSYTIVSPTLAQNGDNIQVVVSSDFGTVQSNPVTLTVDQPAQVTITTQPSSQTVVVGQSAVLTVVAAGSPALTYQWYQAGSGTIRGANQPSYTTPIFTAAGTQSFYVVVGNPLGQLQSSTAVVTVGAPTPVAITTEPASVIVPVNEPVQFTAVVAGSAPYTYQWQFTPTGGSAIILTGGTQLSNTILYSIPAVTSANVGAYTVTVNNAASQAVTSTAAQITLAPPGVNLALDKTATSSSTQNACTDGTTTPPFSGTGCLGPENAVDGNLATRWGSATAGAPPTPPVPGVDPSWLQVDLGSVQAFNTVILIWENAYATQYQILYTSADPSTNPTWNVAISNNAGKGGTETLNFPTVSARYIRMNGIQRATQYGYSLYEFQVYNVPQCGGATERYTINPSNAALVTDNQSGLMWTRTVETSTTPGSQFTGVNAVAYCSTLDMRLPLLSEALGISSVNNATCAFPGVWSTWTSTVDPNDGTRTGYVNFDGTSSWQVTNNYPGATLCVTGTGFGSIPPAPPNAPTNLTATAASSSQINLAWTASAGSGVTYTVLRNGASVTSNVTGTSYSDTGLTASTTYSYTVEAVDSDGTSPASNTATATTPPAGCTSDCGESPDVLAIHAGGVAVGNFAADEDYVGGSASATTATISTAGVTNPAPEAVYQTQRFGNFTYTLPGLTTAASYTVRLHFSEYYWTAAGKRVFNVSINGTQVLTNFDIFAAVGGDQALVEEFTATANASGQIAIVFTTVSDNAEVAGIEVLASGSVPPAPPNAPTSLAATAVSSSQINLSWTASATAGVTYSVLRNGTGIANGLTATSYSDTGLAPSTTYSYTVEAVDSAGPSLASNTATATTPANSCTSDCGMDVLAIHAGGGAVGNFAADEDFVGGTASATTATISTTGVTDPAPEAVYQTQRFGNFTYMLPGLTAGTSYTVRLHFSEYYWTAAGKRVFNVSINGTQVLTNFDIFALVGADQAIVEQFTATANASGQIVIVFTTVSDNAEVAGIEVLSSGGTGTTPPPPPAVPNAPTNLMATAASSNQINLSWTASTTSGVTYTVLRNGASIANNLTATSYSDTGLMASTTYSYAVEAVDSAGTSPASNSAAATTTAATGCTGSCGTEVLAIHAGGAAAGNFATDEDYVGGSASATTATISTAGVSNPAPEAVYQTQRFGNFTYTVPGLTPGTSYTVRLHFSEYYWTAAGKRVFNVSINGTQVLTNFDIFALVGADQAIVEQFPAAVNASGQIVIVFTTVSDNAEVAGIEVLAPPPPPTVTTPSFTPVAGTYTSAQNVAISDATAGAIIYYTTNGTIPTTSSAVYNGPVSVGVSETLEAIAVLSGDTNSAVASGAYIINTAGGGGPVSAPASLTAVASTSTQTYINWAASPTPRVNYLVFRGTTPNFTPSASSLVCTYSQSVYLAAATSPNPYQVCTTWSMTNLADNNAGQQLQPATTYYYMVEAMDSSGNTSSPAGPAAVTTLGASTTGAPATLTALTATAASANEIDLTWNASAATNSDTAVIMYSIYRSTSPSFTPSQSNQIGTTKANLFQDVLDSASTTYYYLVKASNPSGTSPASPVVSATTASLGSNPPFWDMSNIPPAQNVLMVKFLNRTNGRFADDQITWSATINGVTSQNTIAAQPTFDMPANSSGRMYFYLGNVGQGSTDYYDFIEYTVGPSSINFDTTRVDALGIKLAARLTCGDGTDVAVGENAETFAEDRATTFARYLNEVTPDFQAEAQPPFAPYRIVEPGAGGFNAGGPYANYYAPYISQIWSQNGLTIPPAGPNGSNLGPYPDLSAAIFRHTAVPGTFNPDGTPISQGMWSNPAYFFQAEPFDHYAQFITSASINGQQYAFPYNDAGGYSSDVSCSNPKTLVAAIGW